MHLIDKSRLACNISCASALTLRVSLRAGLRVVSEQKLSDVLSEFASTMVTDFAIQAILDQLVLRIVDMMPISSAGVTLISPGANPRYVAASDESALRYEKLQTDLGDGPCLVAYETGKPVAISDLHIDTAFPKFAKRALDAGLVAVFTFPLLAGDHRLGALDLYRDTAGSLDPEAMNAAQTLADVTSAYLVNAQARMELRDSYDRVHESSLHDALTGLPNRVLFGQRLDHAVMRARRSERTAAVLFVDLDHFKAVNDKYGHGIGDELLIAVAGRLAGLLRPGDSLARLSGDEFVVLCEDFDDSSHVDALARRIGGGLAEPFDLSGIMVKMSASVGIAFAGKGDDIPKRLLEDADTAMYQAKRKGGARHHILDIREKKLLEHTSDLERDLRHAIHRGELGVFYQPIVNTANGRVVGVEAFLRWRHPRLGAISPATVIPLAEQLGLITEIGMWVLKRACVDRQWFAQADGFANIGVSVNMSARQVMSHHFVEAVTRVLGDTNTDPTYVTLDVTESVFIDDIQRALVVMEDLKRVGLSLALDDFGTGYSSLLHLKQFPVKTVKIDSGLVAESPLEDSNHAIVSAVVSLAHTLGVAVVAEGVETAGQLRNVMTLDCEFYQGYHFARPMTADDLFATLTHV